MEIIGIIIFIGVLIGGFLTIFIGIPGTFIILAAAVIYAFVTGFKEISIGIILVLLLMALLAEVIEFYAGLLGSKKFDASKKATWGALIGGILGAIFGSAIIPIIGSLVGAFIGAFFLSFVVELANKRALVPSLKAGMGAFLGKLGGMIAKLIFAAVMICLIMIKVF